MRVIVAQVSGKIVKVCESWSAYDDWVEESIYDEKRVEAKSARVREE